MPPSASLPPQPAPLHGAKCDSSVFPVVVPILVILSHVILSLSKHVILSSSKHVILSHVILSLSKDEAERMTRAITQHISGSAWGCSSAGRASALHVEGLGFESPHLQKDWCARS